MNTFVRLALSARKKSRIVLPMALKSVLTALFQILLEVAAPFPVVRYSMVSCWVVNVD